jgi:16S rRNA processing protein RimM
MPETKDTATSQRICLGVITGAHGLRGEVRVRTFGDGSALDAYGPVSDAAGSRTFEILGLRPTKNGVLARFEGVGDRTQAENLKGTELYVERRALPDPGPDEFYHADLIGLAARSVDGKALGEVIAVHDFGAGDLLEIAAPDAASGDTIMLPFTREAAPEIDLTRGVVVLDIPQASAEPHDSAEPPAENGR